MDFCPLLKIWVKSIGRIISKNWSGKCSQKPIDHAKQSATGELKTSSKRVIQKTAKRTGDLIGNTIADKIMRALKTSPQNNSKTVKNEEGNIVLEKEIPREK